MLKSRGMLLPSTYFTTNLVPNLPHNRAFLHAGEPGQHPAAPPLTRQDAQLFFFRRCVVRVRDRVDDRLLTKPACFYLTFYATN